MKAKTNKKVRTGVRAGVDSTVEHSVSDNPLYCAKGKGVDVNLGGH